MKIYKSNSIERTHRRRNTKRSHRRRNTKRSHRRRNTKRSHRRRNTKRSHRRRNTKRSHRRRNTKRSHHRRNTKRSHSKKIILKGGGETLIKSSLYEELDKKGLLDFFNHFINCGEFETAHGFLFSSLLEGLKTRDNLTGLPIPKDEVIDIFKNHYVYGEQCVLRGNVLKPGAEASPQGSASSRMADLQPQSPAKGPPEPIPQSKSPEPGAGPPVGAGPGPPVGAGVGYKAVQIPPVGLKQLGATCYMNAFNQCFIRTPGILEVLRSTDELKGSPETQRIVREFRNLVFKMIGTDDYGACDSSAFQSEMAKVHFRVEGEHAKWFYIYDNMPVPKELVPEIVASTSQISRVQRTIKGQKKHVKVRPGEQFVVGERKQQDANEYGLALFQHLDNAYAHGHRFERAEIKDKTVVDLKGIAINAGISNVDKINDKKVLITNIMDMHFKSRLYDIFGGKISRNIVCRSPSKPDCPGRPDEDIDETFHQLPVQLHNMGGRSKTLYELLIDKSGSFHEEELHDYLCESCGTVGSFATSFLSKFPKILMFDLKRWDPQTGGKIITSVKLSMDLIFNRGGGLKVGQSFSLKDEDIKYSLYGIVYHEGTVATSGHYIAAVRGDDQRNPAGVLIPVWNRYDDSTVKVLKNIPNDISEHGKKYFYVLFYQLTSPLPPEGKCRGRLWC